MYKSDKILKILGIPYAAFLSVISGMMLLSFPIGMWVVFNSDIGDNIHFQYPLSELIFLNFDGIQFFSGITIGDIFIIAWSVYSILFAIAIFGPKKGFLSSISSLIYNGKVNTKSNYLISVTKWFSILILASAIITFTQEIFDIHTLPPSIENDLLQLFYVTLSPITEEIGFRSLLIGIPIFAMYSHKFSISHFFRSLWNPANNLRFYNSKKIFVLITMTGMLFGFAHISIGEPWSEGKFVQASISGIILGWMYIQLGLITAILVHWATNYFIFSYSTFVSEINNITLSESFHHPLINTMEFLFLASGVFSVIIVVMSYFDSKKSRSNI